MKKWKNPEVQVLSLEKTEAGNVEEIKCSTCNNITVFNGSNVEEIICYRCKCCGTEFHSDMPGGKEAAKEACEQHAATCEKCS